MGENNSSIGPITIHPSTLDVTSRCLLLYLFSTQNLGQQRLCSSHGPYNADNNIFQQHIFLVFPDLGRTFLGNLDKSDLQWLQKLLSNLQYLVWVILAEQTSPLLLTLNMVAGLARVLRSERSSFPFITLTFEDKHRNTYAGVERIAEVLKATCLKSTNDPKTESCERDGMLWINRVVEVKHLSSEVH